MNNHSPKPWRRDGWNILSQDDSKVAKVLPWDSSGCRQEDQDNANLIASAPELLDACIQLVSAKDQTELAVGINNAHMVIAKATGKSA